MENLKTSTSPLQYVYQNYPEISGFGPLHLKYHEWSKWVVLQDFKWHFFFFQS